MNEHEIEPWIVVQEPDSESQLAMWRLSDHDSPSLALFSSRAKAETYAFSHAGDSWQVTQPARNILLGIMIECFQKQIEYAVLDPDGKSAKRIFKLREVLKAAREELR